MIGISHICNNCNLYSIEVFQIIVVNHKHTNIKNRFCLPSSHHFPLFVSSLLNAYFCKSAKVSIIKPKMNTQQPMVSKVVIVLGAPALIEL